MDGPHITYVGSKCSSHPTFILQPSSNNIEWSPSSVSWFWFKRVFSVHSAMMIHSCSMFIRYQLLTSRDVRSPPLSCIGSYGAWNILPKYRKSSCSQWNWTLEKSSRFLHLLFGDDWNLAQSYRRLIRQTLSIQNNGQASWLSNLHNLWWLWFPDPLCLPICHCRCWTANL